MKIITRILIALTAFACTSVTATDTVYYYHNDHLGTPQVMTDKDQVTKWQADQTPFGLVYNLPISTIENNLRFPGQYYDSESGLHYNYFRDYDPSIGRYIQSDPIGLGGGLNTYNYALSNPLRYTDPTGQVVPAIAACAASLACSGAVITGLLATGHFVSNFLSQNSVTIGEWPGSSDISDPEIAGEEAADDLIDDGVCDPSGNNNCDKVRKECRQRCIDKWVENAGGGIPQLPATEITKRCRVTCTARFGCGPDV